MKLEETNDREVGSSILTPESQCLISSNNMFWILTRDKKIENVTVVVAQLVEWVLPIPEVRGLNPVIFKIDNEHCFTVNCFEKTKIKKKEAKTGHLKKKKEILFLNFYEFWISKLK